jgi:hypothetical protein
MGIRLKILIELENNQDNKHQLLEKRILFLI